MQLLIHIEANNLTQQHGHNSVIEWTRKTHPAITTFDFNTLSQSSVTGYAMDLIKQADQILMIVEIKIERNLQLIKEFIETTIGLEGKSVQLVVNGIHAKKMADHVQVDHRLNNVPAQGQKKLIGEFFSKGA